MKDAVAVVVTARDASATLSRVLEAARRLVSAGRFALHDDASSDGTPGLAARAGVATVRLPRSGGPARGRNLALDDSPERFILLLDADASPRPDALDELLAAARRSGAAVTLPRVVLEDGTLQHGPARMSWTGLPRFSGWWGSPAPGREGGGYTAGGGTAMLVDRLRLPARVRFDEGFGYRPGECAALDRVLAAGTPRPELEDADFLLRVALAGGVVAFAPRAEVVHLNPGLAAQRAGAAYPAAKMALQSRNRRLLALKCFSTATLLLSAPLQLLAEAALAALAARRGLLGAYAAGWAATPGALRRVWRERSRVQASRRVPDRALLTARLPSRRPSAAPVALALLAALAAAGCGCRPEAQRDVFILSREALLSRPPDFMYGEVKLWRTGENASLRMFYAEIPDTTRLGYIVEGPTAIFVVSGMMDLRAGVRRELLGPGSYAFVPKRAPFRIRREGKERLVVAYLHRPFERNLWLPLQAPLSPVE